MKKLSYLCLGLMGMVLGLSGVEAKTIPTFSSTVAVTENNDSDIVNVAVLVKNTVGTCNDTGVKNGKVYIYLKDDELFDPTDISGIYRNYNETTKTFTDSNASCSYDGTEHAVICHFGRVNASPALINYSDCKDEMKITFKTQMCEGKDDCNIKVAVKGEAIDYNNGNPISLSAGSTILNQKDFTCSGGITNTTPTNKVTPTLPTTSEVENPNTFDEINMYFVIGLISFVVMILSIKPKKTRRLRTSR